MAVCVTVPLGPACVDITGVRAGDLNQVQVTLTSKGTPLNLAGQTITAQARGKPTDTAKIDAVITVTDAANGTLLLRWPGDAVTTWLGGKASRNGVWDLQLDNGTDDPVTVAGGKFTATLDVTRP